MINNTDLWLKRSEEMLHKDMFEAGAGSEAVQFAASMLTALYGSESPQAKQFRTGCQGIMDAKHHPTSTDRFLFSHALGAIRNTRAELQAGLIVNLRVAIAGDILVELIRLAKETMEDRTEEAKNVAAVLVAAAYEGLLRRMGEELAGVTGRPKLDEIIAALKAANLFKGAQVGIAQSYLKFRNDSLHADWKNVDRSQVESCLAFSESLLGKHFS